jgi:carbon storage regulator
MLVLSRKLGEGIVFDGPGRVIVSAIRGDNVRLGFEAARSTTIHRDEVAATIERERETRTRLQAGEALRDIESDFDYRDNQIEEN